MSLSCQFAVTKRRDCAAGLTTVCTIAEELGLRQPPDCQP
jgi:hypothetical protein